MRHLARSKGISIEAARERLHRQGRVSQVADAARALLGERYGEIRIDEDGYVLVTTIDLTTDDVAALDAIAGEAGIGSWVRTRRADPVALEAWEAVRHELIRLSDTVLMC